MQPTQILFATEQPFLVLGFREVLRLAGFTEEPVMLAPGIAFATLTYADRYLVFVDAECQPAAAALSQAMRLCPQSRFVLAGSDVTPEMLRLAVESGVHGMLSTRLPLVDAAQSVERIWQGERQFRFDSQLLPPAPPPIAAAAGFDADWMFGQEL